MSPVTQNDPTLNAFQYAIARHMAQLYAIGRDESAPILAAAVQRFAADPTPPVHPPTRTRKPLPNHPWRNRLARARQLEQRIFENGRVYEHLLVEQAERGQVRLEP